MQITYKNKVTLQSNQNIPDENKVTAEDMNEIKSVVNSNEEEQQALTLSVQEIAQNVANNSQEISNIKEEQTTQNENIQSNSNNISDLQLNKADKTEIPTDLSQLSNDNTKFVNETELENAIFQEKTQRQNADNNLQNQVDTNKTNIQTNATNIATNTQEINRIKAEQTTQNNRLNNLETDNTTNKSNISSNTQEINNIKQEQTTQNTNISNNATNIESLQEENENLKKIVSQLPQVEGQGTSITLENTIKATFTKFDVEGNSTQETTEGKNKFHIASVTPVDGNTTYNKITNNEIEVSTKNPAGYRYVSIPVEVEANTTYYFKANIKNSNSSVSNSWLGVLNSDNTNTLYNNSYSDGAIKSFNTGDNTIVNINLYATSNVAAINTTTWSKIQLTTNNNDSFEPYTGGIASPNPNYEQPIYSAGDNGSINEKISNKNLFVIKNYSKSGWIVTIDNPLKGMPAGDYTISCQNKSSINAGIRTYFSNEPSGAVIGNLFTDFQFGDTIMFRKDTLTQEQLNAKYYILYFNNASGSQSVLEDMKIMIEPGSTASPYVEHQEQDYSIFVQQPMRSIGDVRDGFVKKSDGWYERHLPYIASYNGETLPQDVYNEVDNVKYCNEKSMSTTGQFSIGASVQYIDENNWNDLPCTPEQIQQLENKPSTYKDFTYVVSEDEIEAYLEVSGIRDIDTMFDKVTNAIISLGGNV